MKQLFLIILTALLANVFFTSCNNDDDWNNVEVTNTELKTILQQKGFTFDEQGRLVQNDLALNTTSLDLSGTGISDLGGLDVLPNLAEVDLSDNGYGPKFDFSPLPATITGVDLTGNEIYEYLGLVDVVTAENGDETVNLLRQLKKLYLPASAKYNCDQLVYFYEQNQPDIENGTIDMEMADTTGALSAYTTLREVPDETVLTYLKGQFPSLFTDDNKIDISKRLVSAAEVTKSINTYRMTWTNAEGFAYVAMNRGYEGGTIWLSAAGQTSNMPYLKLKPTVTSLTLVKINTNILDLSEATDMVLCVVGYNNTIKSLDFSNCKILAQRELEEEIKASATEWSRVQVYCCPLLKTLSLPEKATYLSYFAACNLPELEKIDLSNIKYIVSFYVGAIPVITYPALEYFYNSSTRTIDNENGCTYFGISEDMISVDGTVGFINKYRSNLSAWPNLSNYGVTAYRWDKVY
jgi:hypothetical protein